MRPPSTHATCAAAILWPLELPQAHFVLMASNSSDGPEVPGAPGVSGSSDGPGVPDEKVGKKIHPSKATLPTSRARRVFAYTTAGEKVGLAGFEQDDLGFPAPFGVGAALRAPHWVREATAGEIAASDYERRVGDNFYKPLGWQPKAIVHANGQPAFESEEIGLFGHIVSVIARPMRLRKPGVGDYCHSPIGSSPRTPRTPPMRD